jgi:hypothetical protein
VAADAHRAWRIRLEVRSQTIGFRLPVGLLAPCPAERSRYRSGKSPPTPIASVPVTSTPGRGAAAHFSLRRHAPPRLAAVAEPRRLSQTQGRPDVGCVRGLGRVRPRPRASDDDVSARRTCAPSSCPGAHGTAPACGSAQPREADVRGKGDLEHTVFLDWLAVRPSATTSARVALATRGRGCSSHTATYGGATIVSVPWTMWAIAVGGRVAGACITFCTCAVPPQGHHGRGVDVCLNAPGTPLSTVREQAF